MDCATTLAIAETIHGWMTLPELRWLFETARSLPQQSRWVELGSWKGRSFFTVAMGLRSGSTLTAVDSFTTAHTALPFVPTREWVRDHFEIVLSTARKLRPDLNLEVICDDSADSSRSFPTKEADVVFFDADHSLEGLTRELDAWLPKARPDAIICGHDYSDGFPGIVSLIDERFPERIVVPETSIWVAKQCIPAATSLLHNSP
jgi:hypothetical protein